MTPMFDYKHKLIEGLEGQSNVSITFIEGTVLSKAYNVSSACQDKRKMKGTGKVVSKNRNNFSKNVIKTVKVRKIRIAIKYQYVGIIFPPRPVRIGLTDLPILGWGPGSRSFRVGN